MIYLKQALTTPETDHQDVRDLVQVMLARIAVDGETAVRDYSRTFDKWEGDLVVSREQLAAATDQVPDLILVQARVLARSASRPRGLRVYSVAMAASVGYRLGLLRMAGSTRSVASLFGLG